MTWKERDTFLLADDTALMRQCEFGMQKGTGNGGQKINKTSSTVRLKHLPTGISVVANEQRSQAQNRHIALKKLRFAIATQIRCEITPDFIFSFEPIPSESNHIRFSIWVAHLFDLANFYHFSIKQMALSLQVSTSKLDKTIRKYPALLRKWVEKAQNDDTRDLKI